MPQLEEIEVRGKGSTFRKGKVECSDACHKGRLAWATVAGLGLSPKKPFGKWLGPLSFLEPGDLRRPCFHGKQGPTCITSLSLSFSLSVFLSPCLARPWAAGAPAGRRGPGARLLMREREREKPHVGENPAPREQCDSMR